MQISDHYITRTNNMSNTFDIRDNDGNVIVPARPFDLAQEILRDATMAGVQPLEWLHYNDEAEAAAQQGEIEAEFIMSWVNGGGRPEDARTAYRMHQG